MEKNGQIIIGVRTVRIKVVKENSPGVHHFVPVPLITKRRDRTKRYTDRVRCTVIIGPVEFISEFSGTLISLALRPKRAFASAVAFSETVRRTITI